jgi:DNA polymerase-1
MKKETIFLIDANSFCYRAFFAISNLTTSKGMPTGAIYGFTTFLMRLIKEEKPDYIAFCFDAGKETFRTKEFAEYKAHRPAMPDDLRVQMDKIKEVIAAFGLKSLEMSGFEADDIIATLAKGYSHKNLDTYIVTSDKDMCQLINEHIKVYNPQKPPLIMDDKTVIEKFGVKPGQIVDFLALAGDQSDNIPGAKGIGEKTAAKLIQQFGSLDKLLEKTDKITSESERKKIDEHREGILLSKQLATLHSGVPVSVKLTELKISQPDTTRLAEIFKELEFKSLLKGLAGTQTRQATNKRAALKDLESLCDEAGRNKELLIYCGTESQDIFLASKNYYAKFSKLSEGLKDIFSDSAVKKISNDLKAVKVAFFAKDIDIQGLYLDFQLAFYLLDSGRTDYSLAALSLGYLDRVVSEQGLEPELAFSLMDELRFVENELKLKDLEKLFFEIEMPLLEVLADLEICGVKIDKEFLNNLSAKLEAKIRTLQSTIIGLAGREFNINSPKQLSQILFEELKLPVRKRRKSHASTDEEVLSSLAADYPICQHILEFRQLTKLKTTYIDVLPTLIDKQDKIHTSFNQTVTQTGRLSSSNPNLQNIPIKTDIGAQIRKAFIPSEKSGLLLSADYSQIELRILAHLSQESNLISAFKDDLDIHSYTASLIFGLKKQEEVDEAMRNIAKRVNFGIIYGISSYGLAKDLGIPLEEANEFIENYFLRYPKVKDFMNSCIEKARADGFVSTLMGRRRYLAAINSRNMQMRSFAERQAINMPVQGSAADLIKKAMLDIHQEFKADALKSKMVLQVHDELVFDCVKDELAKVSKLVKEKMEHAFSLTVPIKVSVKKGKNWLELEDTDDR